MLYIRSSDRIHLLLKVCTFLPISPYFPCQLILNLDAFKIHRVIAKWLIPQAHAPPRLPPTHLCPLSLPEILIQELSWCKNNNCILFF